MTLLIQPWSSPSALGYKSWVPLCNSIWAIHSLPLSEISSLVQSLWWCYLCSHSWAIWDLFLFTILFFSSHFSKSDGDQQIRKRIFLIFQGMSVDLGLWLMSTTSLTPSHQGPAFSSQPQEGIEWCQGWVSCAVSSWGQCKWPSVSWVTDHPSTSLPPLLPKMLFPLFSSFTIIIFWFYFFIYFCPHPEACGILVCWPGIEPTPLHWKLGVLTTGLPGKSHYTHLLDFPFLESHPRLTSCLLMGYTPPLGCPSAQIRLVSQHCALLSSLYLCLFSWPPSDTGQVLWGFYCLFVSFPFHVTSGYHTAWLIISTQQIFPKDMSRWTLIF